MTGTTSHAADAAALGFLYQAQYALLRLWNEQVDDAAIYLETLDDVTLESSGQTILEQLKHSLAEKPDAITVTSVSLWKTIKAWIDVLPKLDLSSTWLHLVTVAEVSEKSELTALLDDTTDRAEVLAALRAEAQRVVDERDHAQKAGIVPIPHEKRAKACKAFLDLAETIQSDIVSRVRLKPGQDDIRKIEDQLAMALTTVLAKDRPHIARSLVEWWNRQIIHAHCGKREKAIPRFELIGQFTQIVADLKNDTLVDHFASELPPSAYQSHAMVGDQLSLIDASEQWRKNVVMNEWRARESRSRWLNDNPRWRQRINQFDDRLVEEWGYRHSDMCLECEDQSDDFKKENGRKVLRWSFLEAPSVIERISPTVESPSYVRGTFHTLSISGRVGWHPDYLKLLGFKK